MIHPPTLRETLRYGRRPVRWRRPPTCGAFPTWPFTLGGGFDYVAPGMHDQLQAYWKLGEASGTRVDSHGSNDLTDNNTVTQAAGIQGNAAQFTAANSESLSIADNAALSMGDIDFTVCAWAYLDNTGIVRDILAKHQSAGDQRAYRLNIQASNKAFFYVDPLGTSIGEASVTANTFGAWGALAWHLVIAWHDATANTIYIQVDNTGVDSTGFSAGVFDNTVAFQLGNSGNDEFFNGRIDEAAVWKRVLTSDERSYLWNGGLGRTYPLTTP